jgi:hypothetical protein
VYYSKQIRREVRQLFAAMPLDITVDDFNGRVERFRAQYANKERNVTLMATMGDIMNISITDMASAKDEEMYDFYVRREFTAGHVELLFEKPQKKGNYFGCKNKRDGFSKGYVAAVIRRGCEQEARGVAIRMITMQILNHIKLPIIPLKSQITFDKVMAYTQTDNQVQSMFFESVLNRMVDEVCHSEVFLFQNVSLIKQVAQLEDIRSLDQEQREEQISKVYYAITKENNGLLAEMAEAIGITGMLDYEKN